jgi:hypothetical protein
MKTKHLITVASAFVALTVSSSAAVMNITVDTTGSFLQNGAEPDGALSLASKAFYSSFQTPASVANNPTNNFEFLEGVVANWNASRSPILPTPTYSLAAANNDSITSGNGFTTAEGYDYVVFHFGNGQAGAGGQNDDENGWWAAWYLGGKAATFSLPQEGNPLQNVGGFSSARYFNGTGGTPRTVPDGGSTFLAFGIGLLGLGGVRRFLLTA